MNDRVNETYIAYRNRLEQFTELVAQHRRNSARSTKQAGLICLIFVLGMVLPAFTPLTFMTYVMAVPAAITAVIFFRLSSSTTNFSSFRDSALPAIEENVEAFFAQAASQGNVKEILSQWYSTDFANSQQRSGIPVLLTEDYGDLMQLVRDHALFLVSNRQQ